MKSSPRVNDRGIGIAVSVEISPGKAAQARDSGEGMNIGEGSVAVVSQDDGNAIARAEDDIEIAVGLDINRPRPGVMRIDHRPGQLGLSRHVGEPAGSVLAEQAHATGAGENQICLEIVVEVKRHNALGQRRHRR